jgi:hypothetical protein
MPHSWVPLPKHAVVAMGASIEQDATPLHSAEH